MPEYFPKIDRQEGVLRQIQDVTENTPNIGAEIARQLGNVGESYFKAKADVNEKKKAKTSKEEEDKNKASDDLALEAMKGVARGDLLINTDKGEVNWRELHKHVIPNPEADKRKGYSVSEMAKPASQTLIAIVNGQLPRGIPKFEQGATLGQVIAARDSGNIDFKRGQIKEENAKELEENILSLKKQVSDLTIVGESMMPRKLAYIDELGDIIAEKEQKLATLTGGKIQSKPITPEPKVGLKDVTPNKPVENPIEEQAKTLGDKIVSSSKGLLEGLSNPLTSDETQKKIYEYLESAKDTKGNKELQDKIVLRLSQLSKGINK